MKALAAKPGTLHGGREADSFLRAVPELPHTEEGHPPPPYTQRVGK